MILAPTFLLTRSSSPPRLAIKPRKCEAMTVDAACLARNRRRPSRWTMRAALKVSWL